MTRAFSLPLPLTLFFIAAGCSSGVDLQLDVLGPPPSNAAPAALSWAATGGPTYADYTEVAWVSDGSVAVAGNLYPVDDPDITEETGYLARFAADGTMMWSHRIDGESLLGDALPDGDGGDRIVDVQTSIDAMDALDDGRLVVAITTMTNVIEPPNAALSGRSFLQWYAADGSLVQTSALDATDGNEALVTPLGLLALPDGGVVLSGATTSGPAPDGGGPGITGGVVVRLDALGDVAWRIPAGVNQIVTSLGPIQTVNDMSLMPDGGIALRGDFSGGDVTVGDRHAPGIDGSYGTYVARLEPDGTCTWLRTFNEAAGLSHPSGRSMDVTPGGHLLVAGFFSGSLQMDELTLEAPDDDLVYFLADLDAGGTVVNLHALDDLPAAVGDTGFGGFDALVLDGDQVVVAGSTQESFASHGGDCDDLDIALEGAYVARYDLAGHIVDAQRMAVAPRESGDQGYADAVDLSPEGRLAVTGRFGGRADFGAGPVQANSLSEGFVAVYDPAENDVD
ncbi:MAG TPA: hypothetical protein VKB80_09970 [Kofleriaceae bacterium]|nr:hypothetical protein [Kofleriaceae bacterium]